MFRADDSGCGFSVDCTNLLEQVNELLLRHLALEGATLSLVEDNALKFLSLFRLNLGNGTKSDTGRIIE